MLVYKSEHSFNRKNTVILLMINDDAEGYYYYVAVKNRVILF